MTKDQDPRVVEGQPQARPSIGSTAGQNEAVPASVSDAQVSNQHTPGPWTLDDVQPFDEVQVKHGRLVVASVWAGVGGIFDASEREMYANARLIAAAPHLVSALRELVSAIDDCGDLVAIDCSLVPLAVAMQQARAALHLASEGSET